LAGECSPAEWVAVRRWIAADPEHTRELERMRAAFDAGTPPDARAREWSSVDAMWQRVRRGMRVSDTPHRNWLGRHPSPIRRTIAAATVLAASLLIAFRVASIVVTRHAGRRMAMRDIVTTTGQRSTITLSDGSRVIIGPRSRLRTPERFGDGPREVILDGEAYFDVRHDQRHPFRVHAKNATAEDLGTHFVVRAYGDEPSLRVIVAQGRVGASWGGGRPVLLSAGQLASLDAGGTSVRTVDTAAYVAWTSGAIVFDGASVAEVLNELGHWYDLDISLEVPQQANRHISASLTGLNENDALAAVAVATGLRFTRQGRTVTFSSAGESQ
jgi:transmembrane sensor